MTNDFKKFKKKVMSEHILKAVLFGLAGGLLAAGVAIIACFMPKDHLSIGAIAGISAGCGVFLFALISGLYFFLKKPKDTEISLRVDEDLNLNEKVTTMIEFEGKQGLIIEKQREDATQRLAAKNVKSLPVKVAALNIPALIFGGAVFGSSFFAPMISKAIHTVKVKDPEHINEDTKDTIDEIKDLIHKSGASKELQDALLKLVDQLQGDLEDVTVIEERQKIVDSYKLKVDDVVNKYNSSDEIGAALYALVKDKTDDLSKLLAEFAQNIEKCDNNGTLASLDKIQLYLLGDAVTDGLVDDAFCSALTEIASTITQALTDSKVEPGIEMYNALNTFQIELNRISTRRKGRMQEIAENKDEDDWDSNNMSQKTANKATEDAFFNAKKEIGDAIKQEETNKELGEQVKQLMDQLVDPKSEEGEGDGDGEGDDSGDNSGEDGDDSGENSGDGGEDGDDSGDESGEGSGEGGGDSGGQEGQPSDKPGDSESTGDSEGDGATGGKGDTKYGSNDKVFTGGEDGDGYQNYGDAIGDYNGDAVNDSNGSSLGDVVGDYFDNLYGNQP